MAEARCLGPQYNPYGQQQLRTPSKEVTSVVTKLHDTAPVSQANRQALITPEKMETLKNQNAAQFNQRGQKRLDLSIPKPISPIKNVKKRQRGRPLKVQPSTSHTSGMYFYICM